jgi:GNAT superfamily N-acetyltransferase
MTVEVRRLAGPPPHGFDCQREAQNRFLYDRAWQDQRERLTTTYLYYAFGVLAAYGTVCMDSLVLGTREKPRSARYRYIGALKIAQLGVNRAHQGQGLGQTVVADLIRLAYRISERAGCRYVTLDSARDLLGWYEYQGFVINKATQSAREAAGAGRGAENIAVSMRFDLGRRQ